MDRFFVRSDAISDGAAEICGEDAHHIINVLRLRVGDEIVLLDGSGLEYDARISAVEKLSVRLTLFASRACAAEPSCRVTLYQALPKAAKLETIIQKCVELGVLCVQPILTKRCVARPDEFTKKLARYRRVAHEAAKQSGRGVLPEVRELIRIEEIDPKGHDIFIHAYEEERQRSLKAALSRGPYADAALLIGPEGGFSPEEAHTLKQRGALSVSLGPRILRTETAGMAALAMLLYEWGM